MTQKIFSFFSGAGFLDYGFESEGFEVVYVNEYHKPFLDAYKYSRKNLRLAVPEYGYFDRSVLDLFDSAEDRRLGEFVSESRKDSSQIGFIGGPPCPDFSTGGKNRGRHGENGRLSNTYVELILRHRPDFFLFENVKGLLRTRKHKAFYDELKKQLERKGYKLTERLCNAIEYGAPQDRERIILLGFKDLQTKDENNQCRFGWLDNLKYPERKAFDYAWPETTDYQEHSILECPPRILKKLTVEHWFRKNVVWDHPNSNHVFTPRAGLGKFQSVEEGDVSKKSYKRLHRWRYSPTAAYGNNEVHLHPYESRRISVAEALAVQSLPKSFTLPPDMTLSNMFKTVGNGVPFLAAKGIARSLKSFLGNKTDENHGLRHSKGNSATAAKSRI